MLQYKELLSARLLPTLVIILLLVDHSLPAPCNRDSEDDGEDCLDEHMHPDLGSQGVPTSRSANFAEVNNEYWHEIGKEFVRSQAKSKPNTKIAKNIIIFLGDGMGLTTISAARNLLGGEAQKLGFESFPHTGLSRTFAVDKITPDSACTATALLCGVKTNFGTIGVNANVNRGDCQISEKHHASSIAQWAMDAGKNVGLVTTNTVTDATPAGVYAHISERNWHNDALLRDACGSNSPVKDIAHQLMNGDVGSKLKVVLGGGKTHFIDASFSERGSRADGRHFINEYLQQSPRNAYVETRDDLLKLDVNSKDRLLGLFADNHFDYHLDAIENPKNTQPTLEEMTRVAIEFMQKNDNGHGYLLFIEGDKIDKGHHENKARLALDETVEFSKAVEVARRMTTEDDTLLVVTADHSHAFSVAGYQIRGSDIYDVNPTPAEDEKNYLPLSYANGPSFSFFYNDEKFKRKHPEKAITYDAHAIFPSTVPMVSETHGGEDVPVYALGPWSHLFTGVYDQNTIPHLIAYASCLGDGLTAC